MNLEPLATTVEMLLLARGGWVSVEEICQQTGIEERLLRADGKRRPLCRHFAISSSTHGLKHIRFATVPERITYKHARKKLLISHARALKEYGFALQNLLTGKFPDQFEEPTGQGLLLKL